MKKRYKIGSDGTKAVADIYMPGEHPIDNSKLDKNAVQIVTKLQKYGFETYIVGGAVRDLMQGRCPKDFDIATAASPRQVHRIFQNSRIIGRRFRIVHITIENTIYEVTTFRSLNDSVAEGNNVFGTIEEDCKRRDFSINSLYYNPTDETLLDFNNAIEDFKKKRITSLIPLSKTFKEDPVRMIRALKYSVTTGFKLSWGISHAIKRDARLLEEVSTSRLTEELNKILSSGCSATIISLLQQYKLLVYLLPGFSLMVSFPQVTESLNALDEKIASDKARGISTPHSEMFLALVSPLLFKNEEAHTPTEIFKDYFRQFKVILSPNTPPNADIEQAVELYLKQQGIKLPKKRKKQDPKKTQRRPQNSAKRRPAPKKKSSPKSDIKPNA